MANYINKYATLAAYEADETKQYPNTSYVESEDRVIFFEGEHDYSQDYLTFTSLENNNDVTFICPSSEITATISASTDEGQTWTEYTSSLGGTVIASLNEGDKVMVKGVNDHYGDDMSNYEANKFYSTGQFTVDGNIMSLLYGDNFVGQTDLSGRHHVFVSLFSGAYNLISAENLILPATVLEEWAYEGMFYNCSSLTVAPELPATEIPYYAYGYMFAGCTSLETAPELPATTLDNSCYYGLFQNCTSLVAAPQLLASTLADYAYGGLFYGCGNLNSITCLATDISAFRCLDGWVDGVAPTGTFTKAAGVTWPSGDDGIPFDWTVVDAIHDYSQDYLTFVALESGTFKFSGNSVNYSLDDGLTWVQLASNTNSPTVAAGQKIMWKGELVPSPSLSGSGRFSSTGQFEVEGNTMSLVYGDNFVGQTSFANNPDMPFGRLFSGATGLTNAENLILPATALTYGCYFEFFKGCTNLVHGPKEMPATTVAKDGYNSFFNGCTSLLDGPSILPAMTLEEAAYCWMYPGCTSLTGAPMLPAPELKVNVYVGMFSGCTSLNSITCLATTGFNYQGAVTYFTSRVSSTGTFTKAAGVTWPRGTSGMPTNWTVVDYVAPTT